MSPETVTLTRERFEELLTIERTCGDFVRMIIDLNVPGSSKPALVFVDCDSKYTRAMIACALAEAGAALSIPAPETA